jgi:hypothetical protein
MALIQASASRGSSALEKVSGFIPMNVIGPMWQPSVHLLGDLLLRLQDLAQHLGLSGHEGLRRRHGRRWRQVTATGRSKPVGRAARGSTI